MADELRARTDFIEGLDRHALDLGGERTRVLEPTKILHKLDGFIRGLADDSKAPALRGEPWDQAEVPPCPARPSFASTSIIDRLRGVWTGSAPDSAAMTAACRISIGVWCAVIGKLALVNVFGAPARTGGRSVSEAFRTSISAAWKAAASSSVPGQVWASLALPLSAMRSATARFRRASFRPQV